jgi:hypothetical protein
MAGRVLAIHDGDACRRADAVRVEVAEPGSHRGETFHVRRVIPIVERVPPRLAHSIGQHRDRCVHQPHVVDEKEDDVRLVRCGRSVACRDEQ